MPLTLRLDTMLTKGYVQFLKIVKEDVSPPKGHAWLILGGWIYHATGYLTGLYIYMVGAKNYTDQVHIINEIPAAIATMGIPLWAAVPQTGGKQSQWFPLIVTDEMMVRSTGDEGAFTALQVIEWKVS